MRHTAARANLFLVELILNLFIFVLCAAVCVGLLVHARSLGRESEQLSHAVYAAQTAAAEWQCGDFAPALGWQPGSGEHLGTQYFDASWTLLPADGAAPENWRYCLRAERISPPDEGVICAEFTVSTAPTGTLGEQELYVLAAKAARGVTAA